MSKGSKRRPSDGDSERAEELLKVLSETYLANPDGGYLDPENKRMKVTPFVKTVTPNKDSDLLAIWREAYRITHV